MQRIPHDALRLVLDCCGTGPRPWRLALRLVSTAWRAAHRTGTVPLLAAAEQGHAPGDVWWPGPLRPDWVGCAAGALFGGDVSALLVWLCDEAWLCSPASALLVAARVGRADIVDRAQARLCSPWLQRAVITAAANGHADVLDALAPSVRHTPDALSLVGHAVSQAVSGLHARAIDRLARPPYGLGQLHGGTDLWGALVMAIARAGADEGRVVAVLDSLAPLAGTVDGEGDTPRALLFAAAANGMLRVVDRLAAPPYGFGAGATEWCVGLADELPRGARERLSRAPFCVRAFGVG